GPAQRRGLRDRPPWPGQVRAEPGPRTGQLGDPGLVRQRAGRRRRGSDEVMSRKAGLAALALVTAACGSSGAGARQGAAAPPPAARPSMLTSLSAGHGAAWAVLEVGGSRAQHNNFWQLLVRPAAGQAWRLATPPGVADNGGLVAAGPGATPGLIAGF